MSPFSTLNTIQFLPKVRKLVKWKYIRSTNMEWELILTMCLIIVSSFFLFLTFRSLRLKYSLGLMQFLIFYILSPFFYFILRVLEGRVENTAYTFVGSLLSFGIREPDNSWAIRQTWELNWSSLCSLALVSNIEPSSISTLLRENISHADLKISGQFWWSTSGISKKRYLKNM